MLPLNGLDQATAKQKRWVSAMGWGVVAFVCVSERLGLISESLLEETMGG